jgi:hypothetical protein
LLETFVIDFLLLTDDILKSLLGCTTDSGIVSGAGAGAGAGEVMKLAGAFFVEDFDEDFLDDNLDDVFLADDFDGFGGFTDKLTECFDEGGFTEDDGSFKNDFALGMMYHSKVFQQV